MARVAVAYVEVRPDLGGFGEKLQAELARYNPTIEVNLDIDRSMLDRVTNELGNLGRRRIRPRVEPDVDTKLFSVRMAAALNRAATKFRGGGILTRVINEAIKGAANVIEAFGKVGQETFSSFGTLVKSVGQQLGLFSGIVDQTAGSGAKLFAAIGDAVGAVGGLGAAVGLAGVLLVGLNVILGALLSVVIPLVGGLTALVSTLAELGAVGIGAIGLLPGALAAATAAFGPLMLVADKFQKLFENTAQHTGELFVALERVKNAIFAVMSTGFIQAIQAFVANTLPKLFAGLEQVSAAWGNLFTAIVRLASTPAVIAAINQMLSAGAALVNFFAQTLSTVGPALITLATAALPALQSILVAFTSINDAFVSWVNSVAGNGQMADFFSQIGTAIGLLLNLVTPLAATMGAWMTAMLPAANQFLGLLGAIVGQWQGLAQSAAGQQMILSFFQAMNQIVAAFEPLIQQVVTLFLQFGPTLAQLTAAALPGLQALLDTFMNLVNAVAPGVMQFLNQFSAVLADPAVQGAMTQLGQALGQLMNSIGQMGGSTLTSVVSVMAQFLQIIASLVSAIWPLVDVTFKLMDLCLKPLTPLLVLVSGALQVLTSLVQMAVDFIAKWVVKIFNLIPGLDKLGGALKWVADKLGIFSNWMIDASDTTKTAATSIATSASTAANAAGWSGLQGQAQTTAQYMVDMANNGIAANNALVNSINSAAGAMTSAYGTEEDQLRYEKQLGRLRQAQGKTPTLGLSGFKKAGTKAGTAFTDAYNGAVGAKAAGAADKAKKAGQNTAAGFITSFTAQLDQLKASDIIAKGPQWAKAGANISNYIARGLTSGTKNIANVANFIGKKYGKTYIKQIQDQVNAYNRALTYIDPATGKAQGKKFWQDRLTEIQSFKSAVYDSLTKGANLVNYFGFIPTPAEVKRRLQDLLDKQTAFTSKLAKLQARGLDKDLARAWLEAGYDTAGNLVEGLQDATDDQIKGISDQFKELGKNATKISDDQATAYYGIGEDKVIQIIKGIDENTAAAMKAIQDLLNKAKAAAEKALNWKALGQKAMNDYNAGVGSAVVPASANTGWTTAGANAMKQFSAGITSAAPTAKTAVSDAVAAAATWGSRTAQEKGYLLGKDTMTGYGSGVKDAGISATAVANGKTALANVASSLAGPSKAGGVVLGKAVMLGYQVGVQTQAQVTRQTIENVLHNIQQLGRNLDKSHSPSKVWAAQGADAMGGYAVGVASMRDRVASAVQGVLTNAHDIRPARLSLPRYANLNSLADAVAKRQINQTNVRVYVGDREITDIVRTEIDGYDDNQARALLAGRRGG